MKICDVCLLPGTLTSVQMRSSMSRSPDALWSIRDQPDLCDSCLELIKSKAWVQIGKTHEEALQRFLKHIGKDPTNP